MKKKIGKKKNHHANLKSSPRLKRLFSYLRSHGWCSMPVLARYARTLNVGSSVAELRSNGCVVDHRYRGKTETKASKSQYKLVAV